MSDPEDLSSDVDDFDPAFGPDFDADLVDVEAESDDMRPQSSFQQAAWQRLDERRDAAWLREQLSDWDDWDDFGDDADLH